MYVHFTSYTVTERLLCGNIVCKDFLKVTERLFDKL